MSTNLIQLANSPYLPQQPQQYSPEIGLIGCGGITRDHLAAYRTAGFRVTWLCDIEISKAEERRDEFFPDAKTCSEYARLLQDDNVQVVDIATHPPERPTIVRAALEARKHVLSQKPFVLNLDEGQSLVDFANSQEVYLAVNQNGRWAPHFSYARSVVKAGCLGEVFGAHLGCYWDHTWVAGTEFENIKHLVLYDYAIHWFDILRCFIEQEASLVYASTARVPGQRLRPDLLGQAAIQYESAQATLSFDAGLPHGSFDETFLSGTKGALRSQGSSILEQKVSVTTEDGSWSPHLSGVWFPDAFRGTMGELLCSIEEKRECEISAADNLKSLALCFAAIESAETGKPIRPGSVRSLRA